MSGLVVPFWLKVDNGLDLEPTSVGGIVSVGMHSGLSTVGAKSGGADDVETTTGFMLSALLAFMRGVVSVGRR